MQNDDAPRLTPILPSQWDEVILDALGAFPQSLNFVLSKWKEGGVDMRGMHVLGTMARHPALAKAFMTFNAHVAAASTLAVRMREIIVLRICWLRCSEYEVVQHIILGRRAGLSDTDLERLQQGPQAPGWDPLEAEVVRAVDELHVDGGIGQSTWDPGAHARACRSSTLIASSRREHICRPTCFASAKIRFATRRNWPPTAA
jgi:alkylhydroperoxidase family enzyme